jgi:hypothetical protein
MKLGYLFKTGGGPTTTQTSEDTLTSNSTGGFIHRIRVNLAGNISLAQVKATDVASNTTATAEIEGT